MITPEVVATIFLIVDEQGRRHDWFAERLGVSKANLSRWKSGSRKSIPPWFLERSCEILGVPESFVLSVASRLPESTKSMRDGITEEVPA